MSNAIDFPRRAHLERQTPAERACGEAISAFEKLPPHPLYTEAQIAIGKAKDQIADVVDGKAKRSKIPLAPAHWSADDEILDIHGDPVPINLPSSMPGFMRALASHDQRLQSLIAVEDAAEAIELLQNVLDEAAENLATAKAKLLKANAAT